MVRSHVKALEKSSEANAEFYYNEGNYAGVSVWLFNGAVWTVIKNVIPTQEDVFIASQAPHPVGIAILSLLSRGKGLASKGVDWVGEKLLTPLPKLRAQQADEVLKILGDAAAALKKEVARMTNVNKNVQSIETQLAFRSKQLLIEESGLKREIAVAEEVGGELVKGSKGQDVLVEFLWPKGDYGEVAVDVVGPNMELITVGGPNKANDLENWAKHLLKLKEAADFHGLGAKAYLVEGTPTSAIDLAKQALGADNVKLFPEPQ